MAAIRKEDFLKMRMKRQSNIFYQAEKACATIYYLLADLLINYWINSKMGVLFYSGSFQKFWNMESPSGPPHGL